MDYRKATLLDFQSIKGNNIFQTAQEFYNYINSLREEEYYYCDRYLPNGCDAYVSVYDPYSNTFKSAINFGSNDYLNLAKHPDVINAAINVAKKYGVGAGSAAPLGGNSDAHIKLLNKITEIKKCEETLVYPTGYAMNIGSLRALLKHDDLAIIDQYAHASIEDGVSNTTVRIFKHNDMTSLENVLKINSKMNFQTKVVCVDGVYSMDGDIAPLPEIIEIAKHYGAYVYVDDAHATGVLGENGKGTAEYFGVEGKIDFAAGTLSKAVGCQGGYIGSTKEIIQYLKHYARSFSFSTGMTPIAAASAKTALDIILQDNQLRKNLWENITYLRQSLVKAGFNIGNSETAIFPIIIGDTTKVLQLARYLHNQNIIANHVVYPAVPLEQSRLRISVMQGHTREGIDALIYHLEKKGKELGII